MNEKDITTEQINNLRQRSNDPQSKEDEIDKLRYDVLSKEIGWADTLTIICVRGQVHTELYDEIKLVFTEALATQKEGLKKKINGIKLIEAEVPGGFYTLSWKQGFNRAITDILFLLEE